MRLYRHVALLAYGALAAAVVLELTWPGAVETTRYWPLLASMLVLGLPHGAVDHNVPSRLNAASVRAPLLIGYVALTVAGLALWWIAPGPALAVFLIVAILHWGSGDLWFALKVSGRAPFGRPWRAAAFIAARGLLPVLLPLLVDPAAAAEGTGAILGAVGADDAGWAPVGAWRLAGFALVGSAVFAAIAASVLDHRGSSNVRAGRIDMAEIGLLSLTMLVVSPIFAVGVYFIAWHSPRHVARLISSSPPQAQLIGAGRVPAAVLAWHREAVPLTAVSLAGLGLLAVLAWRVPAEADAVAGIGLALVAALTLPHALVVAWMDRVELHGLARHYAPAVAFPVTPCHPLRSLPEFLRDSTLELPRAARPNRTGVLRVEPEVADEVARSRCP